MKTKIVASAIHVIAWIIFLALPYIFKPGPVILPGVEMPDEQWMFIRFMSFNLYLIAVFYLHGYWLMPRLLFKKDWFIYILSVLFLLTIFILFREMLFDKKPPDPFDIHPPPGQHHEFEILKPARGNSIFLFFVVLLISGGFRITQEWRKAERKRRIIENERITMELSLLRSQINPHFLFNTLNNIYSLAVMKSDMTADAVMKLSDIMRYMTEDANSDRVSLSREADYIRHYVELQKIRLGEKTQVQLEMSGEFTQYTIPPLILMPFVENAFKYGISSHESSTIIISLKADSAQISFIVSNKIFHKPQPAASRGLGIKITRQRLEHLYPEKHSLVITETGSIFTVTLNLIFS